MMRALAALVVAFGLVWTGGARRADAAVTLTVTTTDDELNADGDCSLREAVRAANLHALVDACAGRNGGVMITVPAGAYVLTLAGANEDAATTGDLDIAADVAIKGAGVDKTFIDGNNGDRVFDVLSGKVLLSNLSIRNGRIGADGPTTEDRGGGGVRNRGGTLKLSKTTVTANAAHYGSGVYNAATLEVELSAITQNHDATISGGGIYNTGNAKLTKSSVSLNVSDEAGGGIFNDGGTLQVNESTISGNAGVEGPGGIDGGRNGGTVSITNTTIRDNVNGNDQGGGLFCAPGVTVTIVNTTISGNRATGEDASGGGIWCAGTLTIANSTISGNQTWGSGGGIQSAGTTTLNNVTIAYNQANIDGDAQGSGGGVRVDGGTFSVANSIIAANVDAVAPDCAGTLTSRGYNLIGNTTGCSIAGNSTGNQAGVDARLAPLGDNGGPTFTHALRSNSPAQDKGSPATPGSSDNACELKDQRGVHRPQGSRCDIGAYERRP
jgi:CSLREA domain-containing protein